jgi:hypothetical protein
MKIMKDKKVSNICKFLDALDMQERTRNSKLELRKFSESIDVDADYTQALELEVCRIKAKHFDIDTSNLTLDEIYNKMETKYEF